jgi:hypothetical protein
MIPAVEQGHRPHRRAVQEELHSPRRHPLSTISRSIGAALTPANRFERKRKEGSRTKPYKEDVVPAGRRQRQFARFVKK